MGGLLGRLARGTDEVLLGARPKTDGNRSGQGQGATSQLNNLLWAIVQILGSLTFRLYRPLQLVLFHMPYPFSHLSARNSNRSELLRKVANHSFPIFLPTYTFLIGIVDMFSLENHFSPNLLDSLVSWKE